MWGSLVLATGTQYSWGSSVSNGGCCGNDLAVVTTSYTSTSSFWLCATCAAVSSCMLESACLWDERELAPPEHCFLSFSCWTWVPVKLGDKDNTSLQYNLGHQYYSVIMVVQGPLSDLYLWPPPVTHCSPPLIWPFLFGNRPVEDDVTTSTTSYAVTHSVTLSWSVGFVALTAFTCCELVSLGRHFQSVYRWWFVSKSLEK